MLSAERLFPADHPAAPGHFPGNPVVPGAVLLGEILAVIEASLGASLLPVWIRFAKFQRPVRPGERVRIEFSRGAEEQIRFTCAVGGETVLAGEISCRGRPTAK